MAEVVARSLVAPTYPLFVDTALFTVGRTLASR
jgi:hypothetical protein